MLFASLETGQIDCSFYDAIDQQTEEAAKRNVFTAENQASVEIVRELQGGSLCVPSEHYTENWEKFWSTKVNDERLFLRQFHEDDVDEEAQGRQPKKRLLAVEAYRAKWPRGHEALGLKWKEVERLISEEIKMSVSADTLRRGLGRKT